MLRSVLFAALLLALPLAGCTEPETEATADTSPEATSETPVAPLTAEDAVNRALTTGETAPGFTLPSASGDEVQLSEALARGPVVLTFYRGAWCPYCNTQLRDYQQNIAEINAAGASVLAISLQVPDSSAVMQDQNDLSFPVLSDVTGEVSREYGLMFQVDDETRERYRAVGIDLETYNGTDTWELPIPATYVINSDGTVQTAFVEADYTQRASVREILDALAQAN